MLVTIFTALFTLFDFWSHRLTSLDIIYCAVRILNCHTEITLLNAVIVYNRNLILRSELNTYIPAVTTGWAKSYCAYMTKDKIVWFLVLMLQRIFSYQYAYKHFATIFSVCYNLSKYEKCMCINVQVLCIV